MNELYGIKELYDIVLKATYPIEVGNRVIEEDEIILAFDKIQIGGLQELKERVAARGGYDNRQWVSWETTKETPLSFTQGVFSLDHLSLLSNSQLVQVEENKEVILITARESHESDEKCKFEINQVPVGKIFVYNKKTGEKLGFKLSGREITIADPYIDVRVDYQWGYSGGGRILKVGKRLINGYLKLEAKTRLKEDTNGHTVTGIIEIPKLKLMSDLSIRLGRNADPTTVAFDAIGVPVGVRGNSYVCNFITLNDDIDSDM